jgi:hypothetical protein
MPSQKLESGGGRKLKPMPAFLNQKVLKPLAGKDFSKDANMFNWNSRKRRIIVHVIMAESISKSI